MSNRIPEFGEWYRYWLRDYRGRNIDHLVAFAFRMASHTRTGEMYVSTATLARESGLKLGTARKRRKDCADAGIIRRTGERRSGELVYVRSLPAGVTGDNASVTGGNAGLQPNSGDFAGQSIDSVTGGNAIVREELELERESVTGGNADVLSSSVTLQPPMGNSSTDERERDVPRVTGGNAACRCHGCPSCRSGRHNQCVFKCSIVAPWEAA